MAGQKGTPTILRTFPNGTREMEITFNSPACDELYLGPVVAYPADADPSARVAELTEEVARLERELDGCAHISESRRRTLAPQVERAEKAEAREAELIEQVAARADDASQGLTGADAAAFRKLRRERDELREQVARHSDLAEQLTTARQEIVELRKRPCDPAPANAALEISYRNGRASAVADYVRRLGEVMEECGELDKRYNSYPSIFFQNGKSWVGWHKSTMYSDPDPLAGATKLCEALRATLAGEATEECPMSALTEVCDNNRRLLLLAYNSLTLGLTYREMSRPDGAVTAELEIAQDRLQAALGGGEAIEVATAMLRDELAPVADATPTEPDALEAAAKEVSGDE